MIIMKIHGLAKIERRESLVGQLLAGDFVHDAEAVTVEVPGEIIVLVYVEAQDVVVKFTHDDISRLVLAAGGDENHLWHPV